MKERDKRVCRSRHAADIEHQDQAATLILDAIAAVLYLAGRIRCIEQELLKQIMPSFLGI